MSLKAMTNKSSGTASFCSANSQGRLQSSSFRRIDEPSHSPSELCIPIINETVTTKIWLCGSGTMAPSTKRRSMSGSQSMLGPALPKSARSAIVLPLPHSQIFVVTKPLKAGWQGHVV